MRETCQIEFCECCVVFECFAQFCCSNIIDPVTFVFDFERKNEMKQNFATTLLKQTPQVKCREGCV